MISTKSKVSVIVPNYNGISILRNCLLSLLEHDRKPDQIVVVDNGSSDGSPDIIRREFPSITLVALDKNTGFTGANNAGIKASSGDLLVLLNNDCIVEPLWLDSLLHRMDDPSVAAVTSSMRNISDVNIMDSAGGQIDWMGFARDTGKGESASLHRKSTSIPFPCGGAVIIRRSALPRPDRLFWDELFIYQEDLDLGYELIRTGWKIVYEPAAVVRHMHSATMSKFSFFKERLCVRNRLLVMRKHFDHKTFSEITPVVKKWQNLWIIKSIASGRLAQAKAVFKGTSQGLNMPVKQFKALLPLNDVFVNFARKSTTTSGIKKRMYEEMETIIRKNNSGELHE